jgi:hypothetical protein
MAAYGGADVPEADGVAWEREVRRRSALSALFRVAESSRTSSSRSRIASERRATRRASPEGGEGGDIMAFGEATSGPTVVADVGVGAGAECGEGRGAAETVSWLGDADMTAGQ